MGKRSTLKVTTYHRRGGHRWAIWRRLGLLFLAGMLVTITLTIWQRQASLSPTVQALPQAPQIKVFFNHSPASVYRDPYRRIERWGDDLEQEIVNAIEQANVSIDVAVQELNLPHIAQALAAKTLAGVRVRVILENQYSQPWSNRDRSWVKKQDDYTQGKYSNLLAFGDSDGDGTISPTEARDRDAVLILQ
ncbi:MAG: competence protein ComE, partial [Cyanobacteria bacterium P01_A01_bin.105]